MKKDSASVRPADPPLSTARAYVDAWNRHDRNAVVAAFLPTGTYRDPNCPYGVSGPALLAYLDTLVTAFPDLRFDEIRAAEIGHDIVMIQWVMRGTNLGPIAGGPATKKTIALPGIDVIQVENGSISSVEGFFDGRALLGQLGLQILINPPSIHPVSFGSSSHVESADNAAPGVLSLTMIEVSDDKELVRVRMGAGAVAPNLPRNTGFLGFVGAAVGRRLYTITAWEHPGQEQQIRGDLQHAEMMRQVLKEGLGTVMHTSLWVPAHLGSFWIRCSTCSQLINSWTELRCSCGAYIGPAPAFW
jgi:steroid delta-isomerase-like uncharacterized protein